MGRIWPLAQGLDILPYLVEASMTKLRTLEKLFSGLKGSVQIMLSDHAYIGGAYVPMSLSTLV